MLNFIRKIIVAIYYVVSYVFVYIKHMKGEGVGVYSRKYILHNYFKLRFKQDVLIGLFGIKKIDSSYAIMKCQVYLVMCLTG